jgi:hypothetical protein
MKGLSIPGSIEVLWLSTCGIVRPTFAVERIGAWLRKG